MNIKAVLHIKVRKEVNAYKLEVAVWRQCYNRHNLRNGQTIA